MTLPNSGLTGRLIKVGLLSLADFADFNCS